MTEPENSLDPKSIASAGRRLGFVALLWWIAALAGTIGVVQGLSAGWIRFLFIGIAWVLALFFSYAWWEVRKGRLSQ
jgi:hypothetical protein